MHRHFLSIRRFLAGAAVLIATVALASGCGGDSSADSGDVTVESGSLSKAEFIKRADAICSVTRAQFAREYTAFVRKSGSPNSKTGEETVLQESLENIVVPKFGEEGLIGKLAALGAPGAYTDEVATFLSGLQERLDEMEEEPNELIRTAFPFKDAANQAKAVGLNGCAAALS